MSFLVEAGFWIAGTGASTVVGNELLRNWADENGRPYREAFSTLLDPFMSREAAQALVDIAPVVVLPLVGIVRISIHKLCEILYATKINQLTPEQAGNLKQVVDDMVLGNVKNPPTASCLGVKQHPNRTTIRGIKGKEKMCETKGIAVPSKDKITGVRTLSIVPHVHDSENPGLHIPIPGPRKRK